jgi:hypothetical protein
MRADNLMVPLYDLHEDFEIGPNGRPTGKILPKQARGSARLIWNRVLQRLEFVGKVWDTRLQRLIEMGKRPHVSLAAEPRYNIDFRGHNVPIDLQFFSMSTVDNPGIPESTITMEHFAQTEVQERALTPDPRFHIQTALGSLVMLEGAVEHDFDDAIAALKSADEIADRATGEAIGTGSAGAASGSMPAGYDQICAHGYMTAECPECSMAETFPPQQPQIQAPQQMQRPPVPTPQPMQQRPAPFPQPKPQTQVPTQPNYPGNVAPGRGAPTVMSNMRSGLPGVTATQNLTPLMGDGTNPPGQFTPDTRNDPLFRPDQILDNPNSSNVGLREANNSRRRNNRPEMSAAIKEDGSAAGAQDETVTWPNSKPGSHGSPVKSIGLAATPYEKYQPSPGDTATNPNKATTQGVRKTTQETAAPDAGGALGTTGTAKMKGDDNEELNGEAAMASPLKGEEEEETKEDYGFTKEDIQRRLAPLGLEWSNLSRTEQEKVRQAIRIEKMVSAQVKEGIKKVRFENSGVASNVPLSQHRESKIGGQDVVATNQSLMGKYGIEFTFMDKDGKPNLEDHVRVIVGESGWTTATSFVPYLDVPPIRGRDLRPRLEFQGALESYNDKFRYKSKSRGPVLENIATTTTGAAISSTRMNPALVVPSNLSALLRDTFLFQELETGTNQALFQTTTAWTMAALTQNTAPSDMSVTLTAPTITTAERGGVLPISFKAERQLIGGILAAEILAARLGELYDEDYLAVGAGQAFESATLNTGATVPNGATSLYGTGNIIYGTGVATESVVTSSMPMTGATLADAQATIKLNGYAPDNLVCVMDPVQFRALLKDTTYLNRLISFGPGTDPSQSYLAQGVIPEIDGIEIRQSTLTVNRASGSGSPATTTHHAWVYKKGLAVGMAASRDLMIETFRDIQKRNTVVSAHYDMGVGVIHPGALVELVTSS